MNGFWGRLLAAVFLIIPGYIATRGFQLMKDTFFNQFDAVGGDGVFHWFKFLLGLLLFLLGAGFIAGWIFFRDRKRGYVAKRYKKQ